MTRRPETVGPGPEPRTRRRRRSTSPEMSQSDKCQAQGYLSPPQDPKVNLIIVTLDRIGTI